jgi:cardiolipin synthase (CMP-forming)
MRGSLRHIPNLISSLRIVLVVPIAWALARHEFTLTLLLFAVAAFSDVLDGFLAKRFDWQSTLGSILDPVADKLLLATAFVALALLGLIPLWMMAAAVLRDVIIVSGAVAYRVCIGPLEANPTIISKLNTLLQGVFILCVITREQYALPPGWTVMTLGALTFVTIVLSGIDYVLLYGRRALHEARKARHA